MVPSLAFVGGLVVDSWRSKFHVADPTFGRNPMNIHGVMTDYLRKIRSKVCHAYRVNPLEESVEN